MGAYDPEDQALARQIQDIKKQRRGLDRAIRKAEQELKVIFDQAGIDELEIEIGLLTRRRTENGYEWVVEI